MPGLGLLGVIGGTGHPGLVLRRAERLAHTRGLHQADLRTFQAKMDHWQRLSRQTRATLEKQARETAAP